MDELRDQLDQAFDELFGRLDRLDAGAAPADADDAFDRTTNPDGAQEEMRESLANLGALGRRSVDYLEALSARVETAATRPAAESASLDMGPLDERLEELDAKLSLLTENLGAHLAADRHRIEASLTGLAKEIAALGSRPMSVNTRGLEEAVDRGALHTAADIANLRQDMTGLVETVRRQEKGITELRATLEWIKERLLLR